MKLKVNLGEGGIKGLLLQHVEKVVLGVAVLLVVYFVYSSATKEGLKDERRPDGLKQEGEKAVAHISRDTWEELRPDREKKVEDFPAKTDEARAKINESDYALGMIWDKPNIPRRAKRSDPKLFPPINLEVEAVVTAVAVKTATATDPFAGDKAAVAKPVEAPKPKAKPKKTAPRKKAGSGSAADYAVGVPGMGGDTAAMDPAMMAMEGMTPDSGSAGSAAYAMPGSAGGMDGSRKIGTFYREHYLAGNGWQPQGGMGVQQGAKVVGRAYAVVAVKAVVPFEKQWDEYERALADATGYSPQQDVPRYLYFIAERAEVGSDPAAPPQWTPISNSSVAMKASMQYAGFPNEIGDDRYLLPGTLTMPIPPLLLKSYDTMALHKDIPRRQARSQQPLAKKPEDESGDVTAPATGDISEGIQDIPKVGPGGGTYGTGADSPYGAMPGMDPMGMYAGAEGGAESYPGMPGMTGMYGGDGQQQQPLVKYKLIRFFDFTAEAGKSYRYRVRVVLEDPNRPRDPKADPNVRILADDVVKRLRQVEADDADYEKKNGKPRRTFYMQTDWSDPSPVVTIQKPDNVFASTVTPPKTVKLGPEGPEVEVTEASGKLAAVVWDKTRAVEVPGERTVLRGSVLDFKQNADVLHPLQQQIKTIENYDFQTGAFVADLRGGELLYEDKKKENPIYAPGEMLIVDGEGKLLVRNEVDDVEDYRRVMFIDDTATTTASTGSGGMMPMGGDPAAAGADPYGGMFPGGVPGAVPGAMPGMRAPGGR